MKRKAVAVLVNDIHLDKGNGELIKDIFLNQLINLCLNKKIKMETKPLKKKLILLLEKNMRLIKWS